MSAPRTPADEIVHRMVIVWVKITWEQAQGRWSNQEWLQQLLVMASGGWLWRLILGSQWGQIPCCPPFAWLLSLFHLLKWVDKLYLIYYHVGRSPDYVVVLSHKYIF